MSVPEILVDIGFTATSTGDYWHIGDEARGRIGTAAVGPDELWTYVTADVLEISTRRGSTRVEGPVVRYEAGRLSVRLLNTSRDYDPTNLGGPYVAGGVTQVTPMRPARVRAVHAGVTYDLVRAYADGWKVTYQGPTRSETLLTATDGTKVLAARDRAASSPVGAGEDTGARISRILDSADWPTEDRVIDTGRSTVQATTLEGSPLAEAQEVAEAEAGEFYIDAAGRAYFRSRLAVLEDERSNTSQAVFGDGGGAELPYADVVVEYDDTQLFNTARVSIDGGSEQTVTDVTSVSEYLTHTYSRSGLPLQTDADALAYGRWIVYQCKDPELRFEQITIRPRHNDPDVEDLLFAQVLGRRIGDRITVIRRPPGGGDPIERAVIIRGIAHQITPGVDWTTTWTLQAASKWTFWTIGHPELGRIGHNALAY